MGWRVADKPKTVQATKALARQYSEMVTIPGDRGLKERRLNAYKKLYAAGLFRPVTWAKCFCKETGETYRINGKHTSTMLSGLDTIADFYVTIESYEADTLHDVAELYSTFDSRLQTRNTGDINKAFASTVPELAGLSTKLISKAVSGLAWEKWQDSCFGIEPAERAELLLDEIDFVLWLDEFSKEGKSEDVKPLLRAGVVAAMKTTWSRCQRDHKRFWLAVRDGTGTNPDLPDRRIAKWLGRTACRVGLGAKSAKSQSAHQREFFAKCIHAWNAWRKNASTDLKYFPEAKLPVAV